MANYLTKISIAIFLILPKIVYCQTNKIARVEFIRNDELLTKIFSFTDEYNIDSLIHYGELIYFNPHTVSGPIIEMISNEVIGNINLHAEPFNYGHFNSKELYLFLLYREIQEMNGGYNYDASRKDIKEVINDPFETVSLIKSKQIDTYSFKALFTLASISDMRLKSLNRWSIMYTADSIFQYDKSKLDTSSIIQFEGLKKYYCKIGQFKCDTSEVKLKSDFVEITSVNVSNFEVNMDSVGNIYRSAFIFSNDTFGLPTYYELDFFFERLNNISVLLDLSDSQRMEIAVNFLKDIDPAQETYAGIIKSQLEYFHSEWSNIQKESRKRTVTQTYFKSARKILRKYPDLHFQTATEYFQTYRSKVLTLLLSDYLFVLTSKLKFAKDYDQEEKILIYKVDSLHNELLFTLNNTLNPTIIGNFFNALTDTSDWKSSSMRNIIEDGVRKKNSYLIHYLNDAITSFEDQQKILNIYSLRNIETGYLSNLNKYTLGVLRGLVSTGSNYTDRVSLSIQDDFGWAFLKLILNLRRLNNRLLNRNVDWNEKAEVNYENSLLILSDEFQNSFCLFIDRDSLHLRHIVFPKELINYNDGTIDEMITYINTSFKSEFYDPYVYFASTILYSCPEVFKSEGVKYVIGDGAFARVNWSIVSDVVSHYSKLNFSLMRTYSYYSKDRIEVPNNVNISAIYNLNYNVGLENIGTEKFGQFRGKRVGKYWSSLKGTIKEGESIEKSFPGQVNHYQEISKSHLSRALIEDQVVHIASHADFNENELGHNSAYIVLDSANFFEDNFDSLNPKAYFTIGDIRVTKPLKSSLVVLSACNSGMGKSMSNTFSVNLPAILVANGVKCVIASFWEVDDTFAALYFDTFYQKLKVTKDPTVAFYQTREYFRNNDTEPHLTYSFDIILK